MSRHVRSCGGTSTPSVTPDARSSSSTAGRQVVSTSGGDVGYFPTQLSTLLNSIILEAVPAVLDQHGCYSQAGLVTYLGNYYPEIPEQLRAPIVVTATAGARHAALMHLVCEKNINSPDEGKRQFATGAASSLSFWALGMLPVHRSGNVYKPREPVKPPVATVTHGADESLCFLKESMSGMTPPTASTDQGLEGKGPVLNDMILPVPLGGADAEFDVLMSAQASNLQSVVHDLFAEIPSVVQPVVQPVAQPSAEGQQERERSGVSHPEEPQCQEEGREASTLARVLATPSISIHAISDIESDGEVRSVVTVRAGEVKKVAAEATVRRVNKSPKGSEAPHQTTVQSGRKRESPPHHCHQQRQSSPNRKQSRNGTSGFLQRPTASYRISAEEYRELQDLRRDRRRYRK